MIRLRMILALIVLAGLAVYTTVGTVRAEQPEEKTSGSKVRVGTFDSRAVAVAYGRSEAFGRYIEGLTAEYEKAKAAGDETRVRELEAQGPAQQQLLGKQAFSTWPVDNILEQIKEKIPEIAKQAEVDVILSKWDIVYQGSGIELIDVTDLMVKPFNPDEKTLKTLKELQEQDPVPLEELEEH
jgi:hypothetical protein